MKDNEKFVHFELYNYGTAIFLDLDGFKNCTEEMSWRRWTPNPITEYLSNIIVKL